MSIAAAVVRYELHGRRRKGVATTFLADRVFVNETLPIYVQPNSEFRLPNDGAVGIIMVGAGTGVAPYRAFLQERHISNASGDNILFFGCRHEDRDFLYKDELKRWEKEGHVELYTAFSRDSSEKVYVQNRITENADRVWRLLEDGAHLYVCGDASHMAPDVHSALLR